MGRAAPLASLALGRSPYDEVVMGDGPPGPPNEHEQQYDERGRPINPETKRINRDVIRSHNEVMMVVGVAEHDYAPADTQPQAEAEARHNESDRINGQMLMFLGGVLETAGVWGVNGLRHRILLYKQYTRTPFTKLFDLARREQGLLGYFFSGLPSFLVSNAMEQVIVPRLHNYSWAPRVSTYIHLHLAIYSFFQRTGILTSSSRLPPIKFFIPGTSISPIPIPRLPSSFHPKGLLGWVGSLAVGLAPFVALCIYTRIYGVIANTVRFAIYRRLPRPTNPYKPGAWMSQAPRAPAAVAEDTPQSRAEEPLVRLVEGPPPSQQDENVPPGPPRRQSTISIHSASGGAAANPATASTTNQPPPPPPPAWSEDLVSDSDDGDQISATLISFDVEAAEVTDTATQGVWSAELRPNVAEGAAGPGGQEQPALYRDTILTRTPAVLASHIFTIFPARLLSAPFAGYIWLSVARQYMARLGMSTAAVHALSFTAPFSWQGILNLVGIELSLLSFHGEVWMMTAALSLALQKTTEEWLEMEEREREERQERQEATDDGGL